MKKTPKYNKIYIFLLLTIPAISLLIMKRQDINRFNTNLHISSVFANHEEEDDEDEDEHEDDDREDDDEREDNEEEVTYEEVTVPVTTTVPTQIAPVVIRYVSILDPGYNIDTDKDGLVDAIDPHPATPEQDLFTDDDNDGVPNALDKFKGENDFEYVEFTDSNNNGILDSFEN